MKKIYTALTAVFKANYQLDTKAMDAIIDYNINIMQVDGLYVNGSTGEFSSLTLAMKKELLAYVYQKAHQQVELIAQIGGISIIETLELGKYAKAIGYTKISCISPFYLKASFEAHYAYLTKVANTLKLDFYPYYIPALTGITFSVAEITKLLNIKYTKGLKFTSTNVKKMHQIKIQNPDKEIYLGWDEMLIAGLEADITGFIGSTYALSGLIARATINAFEAHDWPRIHLLMKQNFQVLALLNDNNLIETIKYAILDYYELDHNYATFLPIMPLTSKEQVVAKNIINQMKLPA